MNRNGYEFPVLLDSLDEPSQLNVLSNRHNYSQPLLIFILGMGCNKKLMNFFREEIEYYTTYSLRNRELSKHNIIFICNTKYAIRDIANIRLFCKSNYLQKHKVVKELSEFVQNKSKVHPAVCMYGMSYGGAICNAVSEMINPDNLRIRTFGSIYISREPKLNKRHVENYMYTNDVAFEKLAGKCKKNINIKMKNSNNKSPNNNNTNTEDSDRILPTNKRIKKTLKNKLSIFGTKEQWRIHNSYLELLRNTAIKDINQFMIPYSEIKSFADNNNVPNIISLGGKKKSRRRTRTHKRKNKK